MSRASTPDAEVAPAPWRALAVACVGLVFVLGLLGASPELHAVLHAGADHAGHTCAVTLFSQGIETSAPPVLPDSPPVLVAAGDVAPAASPFVAAGIDRPSLARGPPQR